MKFEPVLEFEVSGAGKIALSQRHYFALTFQKRGYAPFQFRRAGSSDPIQFSATAEVKASLFVGGDISVMVGGGRGSANAQAGIFGAFGPEFALQTNSSAPGCISGSAKLRADVGLRLELWVKRWNLELAKVSSPSKTIGPFCGLRPPAPPPVPTTPPPTVPPNPPPGGGVGGPPPTTPNGIDLDGLAVRYQLAHQELAENCNFLNFGGALASAGQVVSISGNGWTAEPFGTAPNFRSGAVVYMTADRRLTRADIGFDSISPSGQRFPVWMIPRVDLADFCSPATAVPLGVGESVTLPPQWMFVVSPPDGQGAIVGYGMSDACLTTTVTRSDIDAYVLQVTVHRALSFGALPLMGESWACVPR